MYFNKSMELRYNYNNIHIFSIDIHATNIKMREGGYACGA